MNFKNILTALLALAVMACNPTREEQPNEREHNHGHEPGTEEEIKFQYTAYSNEFELFAEADAFIPGTTCNVLSHFSTLPNFKAVESGVITILLIVNGKETRQTLDKPTRKGIYSFDITPETEGTGTMKFEIANEKGNYEIIVPDVTVYRNMEEARKAAENAVVPKTNTTVFTKEQSWKTDFETSFPGFEPFGQVIKATAIVESASGNEIIISAKSNGFVVFGSINVLEGMDVSAGQSLFSISGSEFADNNVSVKLAEAKSNFEKADADYERAKELTKDKIVPEKDLLTSKNLYENAKAVYDNLSRNFGKSGQLVKSPLTGFIKQVLVKNGSYVESGQPLIIVSQNNKLLLTAEVPQRYASVLGQITSATIHNFSNNETYSIEDLNGKILSYGKAANDNNYHLPISFQIDNTGNFLIGSFVEVYLKTISEAPALIVPNEALLEEQGNYFTWVQVTPELFEKREVHIGSTDGLYTEIIKGISSGERIVTRGAMLIKLAQATGTLDAHSGHNH